MPQKSLVLIIIGVIIVAAVATALYQKSRTSTAQSHPTYSVNLMSATSYVPGQSTMLHFSIQDQTGATLKSFDTVHEKLLHLIVVRADRTNFQHVHPALDPKTGMFMLDAFTFPTDGPYRVFADFTPTSAQKDAMGMKIAATPYKDVQVGDLSNYKPEVLTAEKLTSSVNGLDTNVYFPAGDDSPGAVPMKDFYAKQENNVFISVNKNGQPFTKLQPYLGALGHMVVLGPNLEFIHAHPQAADVNNQNGLITYAVNFPSAGRYKLYLQTQEANQVNTTDYALSVQESMGSSSSMGSMPGMNH